MGGFTIKYNIKSLLHVVFDLDRLKKYPRRVQTYWLVLIDSLFSVLKDCSIMYICYLYHIGTQIQSNQWRRERSTLSNKRLTCTVNESLIPWTVRSCRMDLSWSQAYLESDLDTQCSRTIFRDLWSISTGRTLTHQAIIQTGHYNKWLSLKKK